MRIYLLLIAIAIGIIGVSTIILSNHFCLGLFLFGISVMGSIMATAPSINKN